MNARTVIDFYSPLTPETEKRVLSIFEDRKRLLSYPHFILLTDNTAREFIWNTQELKYDIHAIFEDLGHINRITRVGNYIIILKDNLHFFNIKTNEFEEIEEFTEKEYLTLNSISDPLFYVTTKEKTEIYELGSEGFKNIGTFDDNVSGIIKIGNDLVVSFNNLENFSLLRKNEVGIYTLVDPNMESDIDDYNFETAKYYRDNKFLIQQDKLRIVEVLKNSRFEKTEDKLTSKIAVNKSFDEISILNSREIVGTSMTKITVYQEKNDKFILKQTIEEKNYINSVLAIGGDIFIVSTDNESKPIMVYRKNYELNKYTRLSQNIRFNIQGVEYIEAVILDQDKDIIDGIIHELDKYINVSTPLLKIISKYV